MIEVITVKQATYQTWLDSEVVSSIFLQYLSCVFFFFIVDYAVVTSAHYLTVFRISEGSILVRK